jgi:hypothetical protein
MPEEVEPTNEPQPTQEAPKLEPEPMNREQLETLRNKLQKKYH